MDYDGKYIQIVHDNSHDEYGALEIIKDQCTKIDYKVNEKNKIEYSVGACLNKPKEVYPLFSIEKRE